ncbi:MAG: efflux RND transporter periplasmic adaptor subunit [Thermodesulfobacteriota bacterium]
MHLSATLQSRKKLLMVLAGILAAFVLLRLVVFGPQRVQGVRPVRQDLVAQVYGNGTVEAKEVVNVASKITGRIVAVGADQGDMVTRGQVLARLDTSELEAQHRQARATLALAEKNAARFAALAAKELVSRQEAEQYETSLLLAREAAIASQSRLADATIVAPADGVIIRRLLEPGATVTAGVQIFLLADPGSVWVTAHVDESQLKGLAPGQQAIISLRSASGEKIPGLVARLGRESDRVTEELEVDVAFVRPRPEFHLGEQAEVWITAGKRQGAMALPRAAVVVRDGKHGVWCIEQGRLRFREVTIGIEDRQGMVEVVAGLDDQATVAMAPAEKMQRFTEGQRVRVGR